MIKSTSGALASPLSFLKRGNNLLCVSLLMWLLQVGFRPLPPSSYLTVLHGIIEEVVQQQTLKLSVSVKRLFDFTQEDTSGKGREKC